MAPSNAITCPSCGGDVPVTTRAAQTAACPYCQSTLIVNEAAIRVRGKMALLAEQPSCLAVGWPARCAGREIMVLGRLQFRYQAGLWDEWWVQFADDQSFAWISQDEDEYTFERPIKNLVAPDYETLQPGDRFKIGKRWFWIEEKDQAVMVGMQGELPRDAAPDSTMRYLELSDNKNHVTFEYFEDGTSEGFLGKRLRREELQSLAGEDHAASDRPYSAPRLQNPAGIEDVDDEAAVITTSSGLRPRTVSCPQCGGSVEVQDSRGTAMVVCSHCRSGLDVVQPGAANLLYAVREGERKQRPLAKIPIGAKFQFMRQEWTVLGRVRYREDDPSGEWIWDEWQLHSPQRGYAFLGIEDGHWMWFEPLTHHVDFDPRSSAAKEKFSLLGQRFTVFERSVAVITDVEGELSWVARRGDKLGYMDAVRPPQMVSAEWTRTEVEWMTGRYLTRDEVAEAFRVEPSSLPYPSGVAPAQPFQQTAGHRHRAFLGLAVAAFLFLIAGITWSTGDGTKIFDSGPINSGDYLSERGFVSDPIEFAAGSHICRLVAHGTQLDNSWVALSVAFLDENENVLLDSDQTVEYYHGNDDGSWSEGSRDDESYVVLEGPKAYRLNVFGESGKWSTAGEFNSPVGSPVQIEMYRGATPARYFLTAALLALVYPVWEYGRMAIFETRRWPKDDDEDEEDD